MWINLLCLLTFGLFGCQTPANKPVEPIKEFSSAWPKAEWQNYIFNKVKDMPKASDEKEFCPQGLTQRNWVHLLAAMSKFESNFNPKLEYKENFPNGRGELIVSTGLFQVSYESSWAVRPRTKHEELHDPYINIDIAVALMRKYVSENGVVANHSGTAWWGASRYWSVMRPHRWVTINGKRVKIGKLPEVKAYLAKYCE